MLGALWGFLASVRASALALGESSVPPLPSVTTPTLPVPPVPGADSDDPCARRPAPDVPAPDVPVFARAPGGAGLRRAVRGQRDVRAGVLHGRLAVRGRRVRVLFREPRPGPWRGAAAASRRSETRPPRFKTRGDDHRGTTLRYRLTHAGLVRFTVFRLASHVRAGRRLPADGTARAERNALLGAGGRTAAVARHLQDRGAPRGTGRRGDRERQVCRGRSFGIRGVGKRPALDVRSERERVRRNVDRRRRRGGPRGSAARTTRATAGRSAGE